MAAPIPRPAKPFSEIGVSMTRRGPNSSSMPRLTLYAPLYSATSSPMRKILGSSRMAWVMASRSASRNSISLVDMGW